MMVAVTLTYYFERWPFSDVVEQFLPIEVLPLGLQGVK